VDPNFAAGRVGLGAVYSIEKKPEDALKEYEEALKVDPRYNPAIFAKVSALVQQKRVDEAITFVQSTLKADEKNVRLITLLGSLHALRKEPTKARNEFQRGPSSSTTASSRPRFNLARLALDEKKDDEAVGYLQRIVKDNPGHVPAALLVASLYMRQTRYDQAISTLDAASQAAPQAVEVILVLTDAYLKKGRYDDAIARLEPLLTATPSLVQARMTLGRAYLAKRNPDEAIKQFEQVNQLDPKVAVNHYDLARAQVARGDVVAARKA
jgi:tetratricopeptide (TPR) repeat protein